MELVIVLTKGLLMERLIIITGPSFLTNRDDPNGIFCHFKAQNEDGQKWGWFKLG
jgi:hypothetical protein